MGLLTRTHHRAPNPDKRCELDWLTPKGITCVLLKYRVTDVGPYPKSGPYPESPMALEDAQRTVGLVRLHATEWHIDPHKIGVLGFSSGGICRQR